MNNQDQQTQPPMNGDDELAKTLNGGLQFEETPASPTGANDDGSDTAASENSESNQAPTPPSMSPVGDSSDDDGHEGHDDDDDEEDNHDDDGDEKEEDHHQEGPVSNTNAPSGDLEKIKSSALDELRPLVGKLSLSNEEKFDTLLLIIRSTDDQGLLEEAYEAAKGITDETKRAQALLDIIKEVDYFSNHK